ncbi:MAG: hypothetical protein SGI77_14440 [Pirellulaceae bacterium]|nr:hypothetical protein [Pirellulaceae bacterium]
MISDVDPTLNDDAMRRWIEISNLEHFRETSQNIAQLQGLGIPFDLLLVLWSQLPSALSALHEPDRGFGLFVRYMNFSRSPQSIATLFERDLEALPMLINAMSIGSPIAETLIHDPEAFELLRITDGQPVLRQALRDEVQAEVATARDESQVSKIMLRFRQREQLRIAYGQFIRQVSSEETYRQLSYVAEAILQAAFVRAYRDVSAKCGQPMHPSGVPSRCCIIALDELGANQQGYDTPLRLLFLAETNGRTNATRIVVNTDFFDRLSNSILELLAVKSDRHAIYEVEIVRPSSIKNDAPFVDLAAAFQHFDLRGRTWERQAFVQAQSMAGDISLGLEFLSRLQPWVYRRYLTDADIAGLGANQRKLQRRLDHDSHLKQTSATDPSRMVENIGQMVLFLQLLHGHAAPEIRIGNTLNALDLTQKQFLRETECKALKEAYGAFRRMESELFFQDPSLGKSTLEEHRNIADAVQESNRIISSRLVESFPDSQQTPVETDLILDPQPDPIWIDQVLTPHRFSKPHAAYQYLMQLSEEDIAVLSTRRCRYFLSIIAPALLSEIARTPNPDQTLESLAKMSQSLGGKGILWELLASNPPTMQLIVRMCACSSYLVNLLTNSPGMIDELIDSLFVDRLPRRDELEWTLTELCRRANDIDRVLREFKNSMHLRVGVRDILNKESIVDTHRALSDIAEVCICRIVGEEYDALVHQFGDPLADGTNHATTGYAVLALGKLGGQEPNYHSDHSLVLLFEKDGVTKPVKGSRDQSATSVRHFFEQLAQRVMRRTNRGGSHPKLYEVDVRFGPLGKSGVLAMQLDQFVAYFKNGVGLAAERQSLCQARSIAGSPHFAKIAVKTIVELIRNSPLEKSDREAILVTRKELQQSASIHNLKRGEGGTVDVECLVQLLQLQYSGVHPEVLVPGTLEAIGLLERAKLLTSKDAQALHDGYYFLREIESGLRLMNTMARHDLPEDLSELNRLAFLLGWNTGLELREQANNARTTHREIFERYTNIVDSDPSPQ